MKSLIVAEYFPPIVGGIQTYVYEICRHMAKNVVVLAPREGNYKEFDEKQSFKIFRERFVYDYPLLRFITKFILLSYHILRIHRREKISLTHFSHVSLSCLPVLILKGVFKKPCIIYCYGFDIMVGLPTILLKLVLRNVDRLIACSEFTKTLLLKLGVEEEKVFVVHPGVDLRKFNPSVDPCEVAERYGLQGKKVILTVSRLEDRKNHEIVIRSLPKVLEKVPNVAYLIVGRGPEAQKLQKLTLDLKLENNVIFAGFVPNEDLPKYYSLCDVFVMLSKVGKRGDFEGFGIVYIEANACEKPVVCSDIGGTNVSVTDGVTGLKVNPDDVYKIAATIIELLTDNKLSTTLGRNGRERAVAEFGWLNASRKLGKIIEDLLISYKWSVRNGITHVTKSQHSCWEKVWEEKEERKIVYHQEIVDNLCLSLDVSDCRSVLEVGAGRGGDSIYMAELGSDVHVLDYSRNSIDIITKNSQKTKASLNVIRGDALDLPFKEGSFDAVFSQGLIEHFKDPMSLVKEQKRVLKKGGCLLVDVPQKYHIDTIRKHLLMIFKRWFTGWETQYSVEELKRLLSNAGLEILRFYGRDLPIPFFAISNLHKIDPTIKGKKVIPIKIRQNIPEGLKNVYIQILEKLKVEQYFSRCIGVIGRK